MGLRHVGLLRVFQCKVQELLRVVQAVRDVVQAVQGLCKAGAVQHLPGVCKAGAVQHLLGVVQRGVGKAGLI